MQNIIENVSRIKVRKLIIFKFKQIEQKLQQAVLSYLANYMGVVSNDDERQKLMNIFKEFDTNGDGQLEYQEIFEGYRHYFEGDDAKAEVEAKKIFEKLDFNNNGSIDYSEFLITHLDPVKVINEERLREVFNLFDSDKSGAITVDEIKRLLGGANAATNNKDSS